MLNDGRNYKEEVRVLKDVSEELKTSIIKELENGISYDLENSDILTPEQKDELRKLWTLPEETKEPRKEMVNHPSHYNTGKIEVIDAIEDWNLNFSLGSAVKYVARADHKDNPIEDLKKAVWYINREIEWRLKNE